MNKRAMRLAAAAILGISSVGALSAPAMASTSPGGSSADCESYVESITRPSSTQLRFAFVVSCNHQHPNLSIGGTVQRGSTVVGTTRNQNTLCGLTWYCKRYVTVTDPAGYQPYLTIAEGMFSYSNGEIKSTQTWSL